MTYASEGVCDLYLLRKWRTSASKIPTVMTFGKSTNSFFSCKKSVYTVPTMKTERAFPFHVHVWYSLSINNHLTGTRSAKD